MKTILITGATSGIGKATSHRFAEDGYTLVLTGRRKSRLDELSVSLLDQGASKVLAYDFDVRSYAACKEFGKELNNFNFAIDVLINNAGLASGFDPIQSGDVEDWDTMIDTNVKGLAYMIRTIAPGMVKRSSGHIINVCSTAGHEVYPKGNLYCASKHAVHALTQSTRLDLYQHGIRVGQVSPGHVEETEFAEVRFHGDKEKARIYGDFNPLKSKDVADVIHFMVTRPDYVNIQDVLMMGTQQAGSNFIDRSGRKYD